MEALQIKKESLAKRCEICHQSDLFDAKVNFCDRCVQVDEHLINSLQSKNATTKKSYQPTSKKETVLIFLASTISVVFFLLYLLLWANLFSEYGIWYEYGALGTFLMFYVPLIGISTRIFVKKWKVKNKDAKWLNKD